MKLTDYYDQTKKRKLTQCETAGLLGMAERSFRRYSKRQALQQARYEAQGADGLFDQRLAKVPHNRVSVDTVIRMLTLFDTQYWNFTPKHFHGKLVASLHPEL